MEQRLIVLDRDAFAHGRQNGEWLFAGQDHGQSVRVAVGNLDWQAIKARSTSFDNALCELERLAALAPTVIDDGFGGYFVPVSLHS